MRDISAIYIQGALATLADKLEKADIPSMDLLAQSDKQSEKTRDYFAQQVEEYKEVVKEIRAFRKEVK